MVDACKLAVIPRVGADLRARSSGLPAQSKLPLPTPPPATDLAVWIQSAMAADFLIAAGKK